MTEFNPENKEVLTYGECLKPAMEIVDRFAAAQYKRKYIAYTQKFLDEEPRDDGMTAEEIVNTNLGYFAGYYDDETRSRIEDLFICSHPVFGNIADGKPTSDEAFNDGIKKAKANE